MRNFKITEEEYQEILKKREMLKIVSFEDELKKLDEIKNEQNEIEKKKYDLFFFNKIKKIGWNLVFLENSKCSILNYSKDVVQEKYYGVDYENGDISKSRDDVTDADFEMIKKIIGEN
jgi:hypothetical protein